MYILQMLQTIGILLIHSFAFTITEFFRLFKKLEGRKKKNFIFYFYFLHY